MNSLGWILVSWGLLGWIFWSHSLDPTPCADGDIFTYVECVRERLYDVETKLFPRCVIHRYVIHRYVIHRYVIDRYVIHRYVVHIYAIDRNVIHRNVLHRYVIHRYVIHRYVVHR